MRRRGSALAVAQSAVQICARVLSAPRLLGLSVYRIACAISQFLVSFDHMLCMAKAPVARVTFVVFSRPLLIQAHASAASSPVTGLAQPPGGNWSVSVSAYSWPATIEKASSTPWDPRLTKLTPQLRPASLTYGRFEYAISPRVE